MPSTEIYPNHSGKTLYIYEKNGKLYAYWHKISEKLVEDSKND